MAELATRFDEFDVFHSLTPEDGRAAAKGACGKYDVLIVVGGDGTFHNIINAIAEEDNPPDIALFNNGTLADSGYNFGIDGSYQKAIKVIKEGSPKPVDLFKVGPTYCMFMAAIGAYSDISYKTKRGLKKDFGKLAYYGEATKEAFKDYRIRGKLVADGVVMELDTPFLLFMNGKRIAGFNINKNALLSDGKIECFITERGMFNGLMNYFGKADKIEPISAKSFKVSTDSDMPWCLDGEEGEVGDIEIEVISNRLRFYSL